MTETWWETLLNVMPRGLAVTLVVSVVSLLGSFIVGLPLGVLTSFSRRIAWLVRLYVEFWRSMPVLVTLYMLFFILPMLGVRLDAGVTVCLALILWGSANTAEIVRGAVQSLPKAQYEAAAAVGLTRTQANVYVIVPQALRRMTPSSVGIATALIQGTALSSAIGVADFLGTASSTREYLTYSVGDSHSFQIYVIVMIVYFAICYPLSLLARKLETKLNR